MKRRLLPQVDSEELPLKQKRQMGRIVAFADDLLEERQAFEGRIACLTDEVTILEGEKKRPIFKPRRMNEDAGKADSATEAAALAKRPGSQKKNKTETLHIDRECVIEPAEPISAGSRVKGYRDFVAQDILITP